MFNLNYYLTLIFEGLVKSYAQVFFANSKSLGILLLLVSFFDFGGGMGSVLAVLIAQFACLFLFLGHEQIRDGSLTYNSLMVGTAIGFSFEWNVYLLALILIASLLTLFITVWFRRILGKYGLPFLSIPFLLGVWAVYSGAPNFALLKLAPKNSTTLFEAWPQLFTACSTWITSLWYGNFLHLFFRSIGAIFFQYNDLAGIIIFIGLLFHSRIAALLAVYSFSVGYAFYMLLSADFSNLIYAYIGFNFILTGIALGGFFIVPNKRSFLLIGFLIPITALLISALSPVFSSFSLPLFSVPFNIIVLLTLMALGERLHAKVLQLVQVQTYSPEIHVYKYIRDQIRYQKYSNIYLSLPILGEWFISQAQYGKHTHKGAFAHAYDFDIRDEEGKTYTKDGTEVVDYYCYNLPVTAPASGYVVDLRDGIADNAIGDVNMQQNWGNALVIKHAEGLYSKLAHLKAGSFQVNVGDFVYKGQIIAKCGSSGRSPEPHLHFQIQGTPYVGGTSLAYPISYFIISDSKESNLVCFDYPKENQWVRNPIPNILLTETFQFLPGRRYFVQSTKDGNKSEAIFSIHTNAYNKTYFYCENTDAVAYFVNDGHFFYFTEFYGNRKTSLYTVFEALYKIPLFVLENNKINDYFMPMGKIPLFMSWLQDLCIPFFQFAQVNYAACISKINDPLNPSEIEITSNITTLFFNKKIKNSILKVQINENRLLSIEHTMKNKLIERIDVYVI